MINENIPISRRKPDISREKVSPCAVEKRSKGEMNNARFFYLRQRHKEVTDLHKNI